MYPNFRLPFSTCCTVAVQLIVLQFVMCEELQQDLFSRKLLLGKFRALLPGGNIHPGRCSSCGRILIHRQNHDTIMSNDI